MKPAQISIYLVALSGFALGVFANPFSPNREVMAADEAEALHLKARTYFEIGNYEGALAISEKIPRKVPRYSDIRELRRKSESALREYRKKIESGEVVPRSVDRLPAALRDSYFDAHLEFSRGQCRQAYLSMGPVAKYLKNKQDEQIFKACLLTQRKSI